MKEEQFNGKELELIEIAVDQWKIEYCSSKDFKEYEALSDKIKNMLNAITLDNND